MRRLLSLIGLVACVAAPLAPLAARAAERMPIDYKAYDAWNRIQAPRLSDDGRYLAYVLAPQDGDSTLVVHDFARNTDIREQRGSEPRFTPDGAYAVYTILPPKSELDAAKKAKKKPEEQPKNALGILELASGKLTTFERVQSFKLPTRSGSLMAFLFEPKLAGAPKPGPPSAAPRKGSPPSAAPAESPAPAPNDLKKKDEGSELAIRDLGSGKQTSVEHVTEYAVSPDGRYVAYATQTKGSGADGLGIVSESGARRLVLTGDGHYARPAFAPQDDRLAFLSDRATFASETPRYALYDVDLRTSPDAAAREIEGSTADGIAASDAPSANGELSYSMDGARLFFGVAPAPRPQPSSTPEPRKVDLWNWRDDVLQSEQRHDAEKERKRTYLAVAHLGDGHVAVLGGPELREIETNRNPGFALGMDDRPYRKLSSWDDERADVYSVALADGKRRLLAAGTEDGAELSPRGAYAVYYDRAARAWFSARTADGAKRNLTRAIAARFDDERDDHPGVPPPYGFGGWLADDTALVYDRYDIWAIDPGTGNARNLTAGAGRAHRRIFRTLVLDDDQDAFPLDRPLVLGTFDEDGKDGGIAQASVTGAKPPAQIVLLPKWIDRVQRAKHAERIALVEQRFDEEPNLWTAPDLGGTFARVSDANPQFARYRWGHEHLVSYRSAGGTPLQAAVFVPDGLARDRRAPMLVYIYERLSDQLHHFWTPSPGTGPSLGRYVSNGYVVVLPDITYRSGHPGQSALDCVLPAVDAALAEGYADPARVGIAGHSWGAYQVVYLLTRTARFRAAEAGAAVANMTSAYGGLRLESGRVREFQYERTQSRIGAPPWVRPDLYLENSPLFHVDRIRTPLLAVHNDQDDAVPWSQGIELFTAMRRLGKEIYLFSYDGELHGLRERENQKHWTVHLDEFFDHFLLGAPAPPWMTQGVDFLHRGERNVRPLYGEEP
jgi:dipeptidyl aminopeptidase/acylaminoacyl peptidase